MVGGYSVKSWVSVRLTVHSPPAWRMTSKEKNHMYSASSSSSIIAGCASFHSAGHTIMSLIGASMSEPHIDEIAVDFLVCIVHCANHFPLIFCVFLHDVLIQLPHSR